MTLRLPQFSDFTGWRYSRGTTGNVAIKNNYAQIKSRSAKAGLDPIGDIIGRRKGW